MELWYKEPASYWEEALPLGKDVYKRQDQIFIKFRFMAYHENAAFIGQ